MNTTRTCVIFVFVTWSFVTFFYVTQCMKVIPERSKILYVNPKYVKWVDFNIKRYGRKSDYYMNLSGAIKHEWSNNISVHFIFYELLHNEYRRTFVEMHFKLCEMLNKDPWIGRIFAVRGLRCPVAAKEYFFPNISVPADDFPHVWPFEKSRVFINLNITDTKEEVAGGYVDIHFKADKRGRG